MGKLITQSDFRVRLVKLHRTNKEVVRELNKLHVVCDESTFSKLINNNLEDTDSNRYKLDCADKIIREWEEQANIG